jgi:alpha-mannosidase
VELDMTSGGIRSLLDKRTGALLISPENPAPVVEYAVERPHDMTAWTIENTGPVERCEVRSIKRKVSGPYKAAIEVKLRVHESDVTLTYELHAGDPQLYLHLQVEWFQRGTPQTGVPVLRLAFPLALTAAAGSYEIPFGAVARDLNAGQEVPALQWAQVTGQAGATPTGCLLVNDSKYGHALDGSTLRLTLIRSSYDPDNLPEIRTHEIHAGLRPIAAALPVAEAVRLGRDFNHALRMVGTDVHAGPFPTAAALIHTSPDSVILSSVKKAEEDEALILTFFNPTGQAETVTVGFDAQIMGRLVSAVEVDLMERPLTSSSAAVQTDTLTVQAPGHGIASVKVALAR